MIIARAPLRISLGGGGTDLPSYYREHGGFVLSAAIDKYVYITLHDAFDDQYIIKYSQIERVSDPAAVKHPIVREALKLLPVPHLEIVSMSDIPAGTGLGSSSSFTVALLKALHGWRREFVSPQQLAEEACHIEMELLGEPIGKQDQYIAAFGGITAFEFHQDGSVSATPLEASHDTLRDLEEDLVLFYTGVSRSASSILGHQNDRTKSGDSAMIHNLHSVKTKGVGIAHSIAEGDLGQFADIMHEHWRLKKLRSPGMTSVKIDCCYNLALENGARGGKLIGAGGGGFLMFYAEDKKRLRTAMAGAGLREVGFRFDYDGAVVVARS